VGGSPAGWWVTFYQFGIDEGPVRLMIENCRTGLLWASGAVARRKSRDCCAPGYQAAGSAKPGRW
jgi:hypothetical protein